LFGDRCRARAHDGLSGAELPPGHGASIALGDVSGIAYYTTEPDGCRVVTTLAAVEAATPIRFITLLQPGQKAIVSVPGKPGTSDSEVEIARVGDQVHITTGPDYVRPVVQARLCAAVQRCFCTAD
jgi:hypothetical protein